MSDVVYGKLIRDLIPEIVVKDGKKPVTHIATDEEYRLKLFEKLREEVEEFMTSDKPEEELADILEVMHAIYELVGTTHETVEIVRHEKAQKRGRFTQRLILDVVIDESD